MSACGTNINTNITIIDLTNNSNSTVLNINTANTNSNVSNVNFNHGNANLNSNTNSNQVSSTITIIFSGFTPSTLTVKVGSVVTWNNTSGSAVQVASDPHPTHTDLPDLNSGSLANGQTYSYTFNKIGTWGYHNHLDPTEKGTVVVE